MKSPVAACKATSETDKDNYCQEGRCFTCGTQGHLARDCLTRKPCQNLNVHTDICSNNNSDDTEADDDDTKLAPNALAALTMCLSDKDKEMFMRLLHVIGANAGFPNA